MLFVILVVLLVGASGDLLPALNHPESAEGATWPALQRTQSETVERVGDYIRRKLSGSDVYVAGDYAYLVDGDLHVIDVSDPATPAEVGAYVTPGSIRAVHVTGPYAYLADVGVWSDSCGCYVDGGLRVIDVSDPATPAEVGVWPGIVGSVYVVGRYAYVAAGGLRVVDVSDPTAPVEVGAVSVPGGGGGIYVAGRYAYVASEEYGLGVVDISDPTAPRQVGAYLGGVPTGTIPNIHVAGRYAYMTVGFLGLRVIDVSDPAAPREVGAYATPPHGRGYANSVQVVGNYAYVTSDYFGHPAGFHTAMAPERVVLQVIDVSDPAAPVEIATYATSGSAFDVHVVGEYAYLAYDWARRVGGLIILRLTGVSEPTPTPSSTPASTGTPTATVTGTATVLPTATMTPTLTTPPTKIPERKLYLPLILRNPSSDLPERVK